MIRLSDEQMMAIQEAAQRFVEILIGQRFAFALRDVEAIDGQLVYREGCEPRE